MPQMSPVDTPAGSFEGRVLARAQSVVATQRTALVEGTTPYRDLSRALSHIQTEYEDRFLYELLQNAYDAHGSSAEDGRIELFFDASEGPTGVLYVANGGHPVEEENLIGLTGLAHSTKSVDESIGNKGVGFRSVFRVCDRPEIYSRDPVSRADAFDGFCFTYACDDDYKSLAGGDPELLDSLRSDLHRSFLPVPCQDRPGAIPQYAKDPGVSTVIRLPLNDSSSSELVSRKLREIEESEAPLQLFLDRVQRIDLLRDSNEGAGCRELTRTAMTVDELAGQRHEHVDLGEHGRYFVATRRVPAEMMKSAITRSIDAGEITQDWAQWAKDAAVSVAVPLDAPDGCPGRMYTHLPMGKDAHAPFFGHATAPFVAKLARLSLDTRTALNAMLLQQCAAAAAQAASSLADRPELLPPRALIDLLAWGDAEQLAEGFSTLRLDLDDAEVLPVGPPSQQRRVALAQALTCALAAGESPLSHDEVLAVTEAPLLDPSLGQARLQAIGSLAEQRGIDLAPNSDVIAGWVQSVAQALHAAGADDARWTAFYRDLVTLADEAQIAEALAGRRVLLTDHGTLAEARRPRREADDVAIFGPARLGVAEDDEAPAVPSLLEAQIATFRDLAPTMGDTDYGDLVDWLQTKRLLREFNRTELLRLLVQYVSREETSDDARRSALRFAFETVSAAPRDIRGSGVLGALPVPCVSGWGRADAAVFGASWPTPFAAKLAELVAAAPFESDLARVAGRTLVAPSELGLHEEDVERWRAFLDECGVSDGLPLDSVEVPQRAGRHFEGFAEHVLPGLDLPELVREAWGSVAPRRQFAKRTQYRFASSPRTAPGLSVLRDLDERSRRLYGELLLRGLEHWPDEAFEALIVGKGGSPHCRWPTPLAAAIKEFGWLTTRVGRLTEDRAARPSEVWIGSDAHDPPPFVRALGQQAGRIAAGSATAAARLRAAGARTWGDPHHAEAMLDAIAAAVVNGRNEVIGRELRRSVSLALDLLRERRQDADHEDEIDDPIERLVIFGGDGPTVTDCRDKTLYVAGDEDTISSQLLLTSGEALLRVPPRYELEIATLLRQRGWCDVRAVSQLALTVVVDGQKLGEAPRQRAAERWSWLPDLCAALVRTSRHAFSHPGTAVIQNTYASAAGVGLIPFDTLEVWTEEGRRLPVPDAPVIPLKSEAGGLLLVRRDAWIGDEVLAQLAKPLSELDVALSPYRTDLQLAFERLLTRSSDSIELADVARAADLDPADLEAESSAHDEMDTSAVRHLALVLITRGYSEVARKLLESDEKTTVGERMRRAAAVTSRPDDLLATCRACAEPADLVPALGLQLSELNRAMKELGLKPVDRTIAHREGVRRWIARHREALLAELRAAWAPVAAKGDDIGGYVGARDLDIAPAREWSETVWDVDAKLIEGHVSGWLEHRGGTWPAVAEMRPLDEVRSESRVTMTDAWPEAQVVAVAWCLQQGLQPA